MKKQRELHMAALETYVEQYGGRLSRLCYSLCKNTHDAQDLYQETWLRAIRAYDTYDEDRPFDVWLHRICINCYRDMYRRARAHGTVAFETTEHMEQFFSSLPDPDTTDRADYAALYCAMETLTAEERAAISLFYFDDYDGRTAAEMLGKTYSHFRIILHRARNKLKGALQS